MRYVIFGPAIVALSALMQTTAAGKGIDLDSREYKIMLEEEHFGGGAPEHSVDRFVRDQLEPAVRRNFGGGAADELASKSLDLDERRLVRFWDTETCALINHGFALRDRVDLGAADRPATKGEITLKFRSPDLFLAADMRLDAFAEADHPESKLEEDIGALAVRIAAEEAIVAVPRSSRSQFSRSTKQKIDSDAMPRTLNEVEELYPKLEENLRLVGGEIDMSAALTPGPEYRELVYESSKLDLAGDTKAKFALTIWYQGAANRDAPALAEVSFSYDTDDGAVPAEAARRAHDLLLAMQDLEWADPAVPTKTALVGCVD
jgi:hypothetical protein